MTATDMQRTNVHTRGVTRPRQSAPSTDLRVIARPAFGVRVGNPYTWLLYTRLEAVGGVVVDEYSGMRLLRSRYDVFHVHWPEGHLNDANPVRALRRTLSGLTLLRWVRSRGTKVVWTVHNLHAHECLYPRLERLFWRRFLRCVDGYISLSESGKDAALARFPVLRRVPGFVIPHGHYRDALVTTATRASARAELGISPGSTVVAFVGQVRPYKHVPQLIRSFRALPDANLSLLVAGAPNSLELAEQLWEEAGGDARIRLDLAWFTNRQLLTRLAAVDLVVLPYRDVMNSGSAILALSFDRPLLAPAMGALRDLAQTVGPAWVRTYAGELGPDELAAAVRWAVAADRATHAPLDALAWDGIARATLDAYKTVRTRPAT
jgi:beta-1,4-mannosyltransferase